MAVLDDLTPLGAVGRLDILRVQARRILIRAAAGLAIVTVGMAGMDHMTVSGQKPAACDKGQIAVTTPRPHIWPLSALPVTGSPGPALRDVMAKTRPDLALTAVVAANPAAVSGPLADLPRVSGGVACITVPAKATAQQTALVLQGPVDAEHAASRRTVRLAQVPARGHLTDVQIASAAYRAGFRGASLRTAVAVALAESRGDTHARCRNPGSTDRGLFQINDRAHPDVTTAEADNPITAAREAYRISRHGTNWRPWVTFQHGHHRKFLVRANRAASQIGA